MNEFHKEYQYEEDGTVAGVIYFFVVLAICFEVLVGIIVTYQGYDAVISKAALLGNVVLTTGILYLFLILLTCISLFKLRRIAVKVVNVFLGYRMIYLIPVCILLFVQALEEIPSKHSSGGYNPVVGIVMGELVVPMIYIISYSVLWYLYFKKSKRVRQTYGDGIEGTNKN